MVFSKEEIIKRMSKYGTLYFPEDIRDVADDIVGIDNIKEILEDFFKALKVYEKFAAQLQKVRVTPSITVLLYGPPGTGKTSITRAIAKKYDIPICIVDADRLVSPLLGDTLKNMRNVVELASEIAKENKKFLLFFDEIDAIASERSNVHEVGEIKRGVISFLQIIDKIDYEGIPLAIFGATNHQKQLDSAVWRRFTYHIWFGFPNFQIRKKIIIKFLERLEKASIQIDNSIYTTLEDEEKFLLNEYNKMKSGSQLSLIEFEDKWQESSKGNQIGMLTLTRGYTGADIERAIRISLFKAIQKEFLEFDDLYSAMDFAGGTRKHVEQQRELSGNMNESNKNIKNNDNRKKKKVNSV